MKSLYISAMALVASGIAYAPEGLAAGLQQGFIGSSPLTTVVHKKDHEGSIEIDPITGNILTLAADRPEWAEGLTVAQISQRHGYYQQALGTLYTDNMKTPELMAFEDLDWLAVRPHNEDTDEAQALKDDPNYDGFEHYELSADEEFRAGVVAEALGIKGDLESMEQELLAGTFPGSKVVSGENGTTTVDLSEELLADNFRSQEEIEALEQSRKERFAAVGK